MSRTRRLALVPFAHPVISFRRPPRRSRSIASSSRSSPSVALGVALAALLAAALPAAGATAALPEPAGAAAVKDDPGVQEALHLLDRWLEAQQDYEDIPALSAAVVHDQELVWSAGYGHANPETGAAASPETIYSICSVSKLFTAVAVMTLYDEGKLRLDDELGDLLPWFEIRQAYAGSGPITLARVLSHSAGLPREADFPYWTGPEYGFPTGEEIRSRLAGQETLYPAADVFQYSNLGLTLAGNVVEEVSGVPYDEYVRSRILEPLGMSRTTTEIPLEERGQAMALGYGAPDRDGERALMSPFRTRGVAPAAGFASTVEDLARFASWQFRVLGEDRSGGHGEGHGEDHGGEHEILKPSTLREMQRLHWDDDVTDATWGIGFQRWKNGDVQMVGHGGYCPGYRTSFALDPKNEIAVIVTVSALDVNPTALGNQAHRLVRPAIVAAAGAGDLEGKGKAEDGENQEGEKRGEPEEGTGAEAAATAGADLAEYAGVYVRGEGGGEQLVAPRDGDLVVMFLPTDSPAEGLTKLRHREGDTFRVVRDNGDLADPVVFRRDGEGKVVEMCQFQNCARRVEGR